MMYWDECVSDYMARYASVDEKIVQVLTKESGIWLTFKDRQIFCVCGSIVLLS